MIPLVGLTAKVFGKKAAKKVFKAKSKVKAKVGPQVAKLKGTKAYGATKSKESALRGASGLKGKGRLNTIRRKVQGPIGYASIGAAAFSGNDE